MEYTALLNEVDGMTARISQLEEEILLSMETVDQVSARLKTVEIEQTKLEQDLLGQAQGLRERMEVVKQELAEPKKKWLKPICVWLSPLQRNTPTEDYSSWI